MLRRKRETDPCPPAEIAPDVPEDLNAICMGLLRRDPMQRMTGQEAARLLERNPAVSVEASLHEQTRNRRSSAVIDTWTRSRRP